MSNAPNWILLNIVAAQLAVISIDGGYTSDAGSRVDLERLANTEDAEFPRIAIGEDSLTPVAQNATAISREMVVVAEGYVKADEDNAERDAANMKWDLGRAFARLKPDMFKGNPNFNVTRIEVKGDQPTLRAVAEAFIAVQVRLTVAYTEYIPAATA